MRLPLTKQQVLLFRNSQQALVQAEKQANLILAGIYAAAGLDRGKLTGGDLQAAEPYLELEDAAD